jgi:hypothetical protein
LPFGGITGGNVSLIKIKIKTIRWAGFMCGWLTALSLYGLFMNIMGVEGYVDHVQKYWVTGWIGIPIFILALGLSWWLMDLLKKVEEVEG